MKLKENQKKKMPHRGIEPDKQKLGVHGAEQFNADTTRPQCRRYWKRYNLYSTSEPDKLVASKQQREICKITKICLLETKLLYAYWWITISLFPFYKWNFVSRRQFS